MTAALALCLALLWPQVQPAADEEAALRAAVQQYYDAQAQRDPDKTLTFWSAGANPRPSREAFLAVFGEPAEDSFVVDVRQVELKDGAARVRVSASRTRLIMRSGMPITQRAVFLNSQRWRKEATGWKLLRDGPFAEEIADDLIAASPADRPQLLLEKNRADLVQARLAISQRATMAITLGRNYSEGKKLFELALEVSRAAGDRHGEANSLHNTAQAAYFLRDLPAATEGYEKELAVGREIDDQDAAAAALFGLATVAYSRGEYSPALNFYRESLGFYEKRDDGPSIGRAVISIGNVQFLQADYDAASASYRRGLAVLLAAQDLQTATFAKSGLARVFAAQGDLAAALDMYGQVLVDARAALAADPRTKSNVVAALESIGEIYYRLGNTDKARVDFEEARTLSAEDPSSVARVSAKLGLTELVASRFDAALAAYTLSRSSSETAKDPEGVARAWTGIGFSHAAREKWVDAISAYRTSIKLFDAQGKDEDAARAWLGLSLAQSGALDHTAALESARKVAATAEKVHSHDLVWRSGVRAGDALRKLQRLDEARAEFQRAIAAIDALAVEAPINPDARGQLDDSAGAWAGLAITAAAAGDARGALDALEARRAHVRRVQLAAFQRDISHGMSPEEQADEQGIVREVISTRAQLRAAASTGHPDTARFDRLQQQLMTLLGRRAEQQNTLYAHLPDLEQWRALKPPSQIDVAPLAGEKGLIVEYLLGDDEILVVTAAAGEGGPDITASLAPVNRRELGEQIAQAMQPAVLKDASEWRTRSAPIAALLVAPIAARLADRQRCVVIPDEVLWRVPFEALAAGDDVVGSRLHVTYATSLATLAAEGRIAAARTAHDAVTLAAFVAPTVPDAVRTQLALAQTGWKEPEGAAALAAATTMARVYGENARVRSAADASEAALRAALEAADVVQLSGPVQISGASPLFSMAVLSAASGGQVTNDDDGRWEVREWFHATSPRVRVLVLTDGSSFGGAGAGGAMDTLAWAAAAAGIPSLAIACWPADGFSTDALLAGFHAALAKGESPAEAWNRSVTASRAAADGAPAGWAGIRLLGAGG